MTTFAPVPGLVGGALIGAAAIMLMLTIGRVAGVSGIALNAMTAPDKVWRVAFIAGLPLGALLVTMAGLKDWSSVTFAASLPLMAAAGFIVGVGSTIGSGCTSGHGICGMARLSWRSIAATAIFIVTAAATVFVIRHVI